MRRSYHNSRDTRGVAERSSSPFFDHSKNSKQGSIYTSINKNSTILKQIKKDASPKVPRHDQKFFPNKTARNLINYEIFNEDLQILFESSKEEAFLYYELQEEYETAVKQINVKFLSSFRSKRNPDSNDVKQGQIILMLLSGIDNQIMLTNDKSNIVQKSWRNFQEYMSSVGNAFNNLNKVRFAIENMSIHQSKFT